MNTAIDLYNQQRNYDYQTPNKSNFDDLQADFIRKLESINFELIIAERFKDSVDYHDISEALKACEVDFETLFNAVSFEIVKRKLE